MLEQVKTAHTDTKGSYTFDEGQPHCHRPHCHEMIGKFLLTLVVVASL